MKAKQTAFTVASADALQIVDEEISVLLGQVYVEGGFTTPEQAASLFEPSAVRKRGVLFGARDNRTDCLAGMIIVVPPDSPACKLATGNQGEVHLLGVLPEYRGQGLGRRLIDTAIDYARCLDYSKLVLWTQLSMYSAQRLYEAAGFRYIHDMERNGRKFRVYEMALHREPIGDRGTVDK